ncbi:hypothetical protein [Paenibacillus sp. FSL R7-0337]|uniref:hypothetical protein n=1 Tax=Paenibacillus sp. FSL R7-0337 TaxID=1926588 RepID=UPI00117C8C5A|nr:hypothetical protein [Paenibacillus sp. FSL R7-0337]
MYAKKRIHFAAARVSDRNVIEKPITMGWRSGHGANVIEKPITMGWREVLKLDGSDLVRLQGCGSA